jgi:hypothetical protein
MTTMDNARDLLLPIEGRDVSQVGISRLLLTLHFWDLSAEYSLQIGGPFRLVQRGTEILIEPEAGPHPAYLELVDKTVARAIARKDGGLELTFSDGVGLMVPPDRYEPWQLNGDRGYLVVSFAGGGLAIWSAQD